MRTRGSAHPHDRQFLVSRTGESKENVSGEMLLKLTNKQLQDLFELEKLEGRMCVRNRIDALGCFLGRYKIEPGPPVHRSAAKWCLQWTFKANDLSR